MIIKGKEYTYFRVVSKKGKELKYHIVRYLGDRDTALEKIKADYKDKSKCFYCIYLSTNHSYRVPTKDVIRFYAMADDVVEQAMEKYNREYLRNFI